MNNARSQVSCDVGFYPRFGTLVLIQMTCVVARYSWGYYCSYIDAFI